MSDQVVKSPTQSYSAQTFSTQLSFTGAFPLVNVPVTFIVNSLAPTTSPYRAEITITTDVDVTFPVPLNTAININSDPIPVHLRPATQTASMANIISASFNGLSSCFIQTNGIITVRPPDQATPWAAGACGLAKGILAHYYI